MVTVSILKINNSFGILEFEEENNNFTLTFFLNLWACEGDSTLPDGKWKAESKSGGHLTNCECRQ